MGRGVRRCVGRGPRPGRDQRGQGLQDQVPSPEASCSVSPHPLPSPVRSVCYVSVFTWTGLQGWLLDDQKRDLLELFPFVP